MHPYSRIDMTGVKKKSCFILLNKFHVHVINDLLIAAHAFASCILFFFNRDDAASEVDELIYKFRNLSIWRCPLF